MQFGNPILGGAGALVRQSIHSPDYVPGVSGWTINKDGSAEFNDVTLRGDLHIIGDDGSEVWIREQDSAAVIALYPPDLPVTSDPAYLVGFNNFGTYPELLMLGPSDNTRTAADIHLRYVDDGQIGEMHAKYIGLGPYDQSAPEYSGSYTTLFSEETYVIGARMLTANDVRNSANASASDPSWVGFRSGKFFEAAAGSQILSKRFSATSSVTTSSGSYGPNAAAPTEGIIIRGPVSGESRLWIAGGLSHSVAAGASLMSFEMRQGATVGSGTVVIAATDDNCIENNGGNRQYGTYWDITGLAPGDVYNIRLMYRSGSGATATFIRRRLSWSPIPY